MSDNSQVFQDKNIFETAIKLSLLALIGYFTFLILKPFIGIVVWAIIIAVTINPLITLGENRLKMSRTKVSVYFTIMVIVLILLPAIGMAVSLSDILQTLFEQLKAGTIALPEPNKKVAAWPFIGPKIFAAWTEASHNLQGFLLSHKEEAVSIAKTSLSAIGSGIVAVIAFMIAMAIAAVFTSTAHDSNIFVNTLARRLAGKKGVEWAYLSTMTIRSVVHGVIGIALIQATVGYIGFVLFHIPLPILWAFLILLIAIAQLPAIIVLILPLIYVFSTADTTTAIGFTIFSIVLGLSDNVLKPLLLGRGVDAPMLVVLIGAIGGLLIWGLLGLFIGAVLLAVAYKLFMAWLMSEANDMEISSEDICKLEA